MPPYEYRTPVNPYAPSIGELLLHGGDAAARAAEVTAAARAHAAEVSGNAWGGAVQQSAQQIGAIPGQIQQQKRVAQEDQLRTIEVQKAQAGQKVGALITANTKTTPDGHLVYDVDGFANAAKADPTIAPWAHEPLDAMTRANDTYQQFKEGRFTTKQAALQQVFAKTNEAGGTTDDLQVIAAPLMTAGIITKDDIAPVLARLGQIPDAAARSMFLRGIGGVKTEYKEVGKGASLVDTTPGAAPTTVLSNPDAPSAEEAMQQAYVASLKKPPGTTWDRLAPEEMAAYPTWKASQTPTDKQTKSVLLDGKPAEVVFDPKAAKYTLPGTGEDVSTRVKPIPSAAQVSINAGTLTDGAIDQAARAYLTEGRSALPAGSGNAAVLQRTAIMNRAAQIDPAAALAVNQATFKADSANLTNLQKTEGMLSSFEKTAGKNIDQFLELSKSIPDSGVPWLNTPIRLLNQQAVGSANMAAINAARDVALREIARVTNDPKLSGALTDSARAEVLGLSPANATFGQIRAVAKVLKQDMANVHTGINDQIATVKAGIGSNPAATTAAAVPANVATALKGAAPGKHTLSDGSVWLTDANGGITKAGP